MSYLEKSLYANFHEIYGSTVSQFLMSSTFISRKVHWCARFEHCSDLSLSKDQKKISNFQSSSGIDAVKWMIVGHLFSWNHRSILLQIIFYVNSMCLLVSNPLDCILPSSVLLKETMTSHAHENEKNIFFSVRQWMFQNWCKWNQNCNLLVRNRLLSNKNISKVIQYFRCLDCLRLCCHTSTLYADGNYSYTGIIVRKNLSERSDCLMISYCMMYNSVDAKTLKPILVNISVWICFEYTCMATKNDMVWTVPSL